METKRKLGTVCVSDKTDFKMDCNKRQRWALHNGKIYNVNPYTNVTFVSIYALNTERLKYRPKGRN